MTTQRNLAARHPDVRFVRLVPGEHGHGAIWKIFPKGADSPVMYARTDEEAERYARTVGGLPRS
ncbi:MULTISPECIES: hypothetical protein [unclassified Nocardiopsis]|uniref:hypothetical protein n=1 Tax=unclassified Nocardiopsis TaxID=2649073 RepID=UPI00135BA2A6|nr:MULTISPECIES: hypothetical protein [unclassified Nocardiopsis]